MNSVKAAIERKREQERANKERMKQRILGNSTSSKSSPAPAPRQRVSEDSLYGEPHPSYSSGYSFTSSTPVSLVSKQEEMNDFGRYQDSREEEVRQRYKPAPNPAPAPTYNPPSIPSYTPEPKIESSVCDPAPASAGRSNFSLSMVFTVLLSIVLLILLVICVYSIAIVGSFK